MKAVFLALLLVCAARPAGAAKEVADQPGENPLAGVLGLIGDMEQRTIKEGKEAQTAFEEFNQFCTQKGGDLSQQLKEGKASVEELEAGIEEQASTIKKMQARIDSYSGELAADAEDLNKATDVREKEEAEFKAEEKELMDTVATLKKAIVVLSKESKASSMLQLKNAGNLAKAFGAMVQASLIQTSDAAKLTALVKNAQQAAGAADEESLDAPAVSAYEGKSDSVVDLMEDLLDKAESQLDESRNKEVQAQNNFKLMKAGLSDEVHAAAADMRDAKKTISESTEQKSDLEGELTVSKQDLEAVTADNKEMHHDCLEKARDFESDHKARDAELGVLAQAKQIINEKVQSVNLAQLSFAQIASTLRLTSAMELTTFQAVKLVRDLGRQDGSSALVELSTKMAVAMRSSGGGDPFEKVKAMISDMIAKIEGEASEEARKKEYCDKELGLTKDKKSDTSDEVEELDTKVDQMTSKSAKLKEDVAHLQVDLTKLVKTHAEMDRLRSQDKETYEEVKGKSQQSLDGIRQAIAVLKDYFEKDGASSDSAGSASSVISLLEDVESRLSAYMEELRSNEEAEEYEYEKMTVEDEADKKAKETDIGYKEKRVKKLAKNTAETSSDEESTQEELDAVSTYYSKIKDECVAEPPTFEERQKRRQNEIDGLKKALEFLTKQASLLQRGTSRRTLRGGTRAGVIAA